MKTIRIIAVSALLVPMLTFGQTAPAATSTTSTAGTTTPAALPSAGLTPDSPFYFLNRVTEALQEFFTFDPAAKARLQLQFAAERISEIQSMLATSGATDPGITVAKTDLANNLAKATSAVDQVKASGGDVSALAQQVSTTIDAQKLALQNVFNNAQQKITSQEDEAQSQLQEADRVGSTTVAQEAAKKLSELAAEKAALQQHKDDSETDLTDAGDQASQNLDLTGQAQNDIADLQNSRAELLNEYPTLTAADLIFVDKAISDAQNMLAKGNAQAAIELVKQGENSLERAKNNAEKEKEANQKSLEGLLKKYGEDMNASTTQSGEGDQQQSGSEGEQSRSLQTTVPRQFQVQGGEGETEMQGTTTQHQFQIQGGEEQTEGSDVRQAESEGQTQSTTSDQQQSGGDQQSGGGDN
ncbi:MAG: hypothetical protein KGI60_00825 [Patescibacteria group bacterium]|nr:hypothetical protein [Patescibacteria group bacterium]